MSLSSLIHSIKTCILGFASPGESHVSHGTGHGEHGPERSCAFRSATTSSATAVRAMQRTTAIVGQARNQELPEPNNAELLTLIRSYCIFDAHVPRLRP